MKQLFELGRVLKPQGIRGEIKAELYTDDIGRVYSLPYVLTGSEKAPARRNVISARTDGRYAYLMLEGIADRDAAEKLRGITLLIDRENAAPIPDGSFYISDLIGLEVRTDEGERIGTLKDIMQTGAKDVYCVERDNGSELLFPAADGVFIERSPENGYIIVSSHRLREVSEL